MPFTLAHPAVVLPLKKSKWFSTTALVTGSIVPDFEFFFQLREVENIGHHWYGIFLFDLPVALLFCFLFHNLLRNLLLANLPNAYSKRFSNVVNFDWKQYAAANKLNITVSLIIGIATHILWDGFTHYDGLFVTLIPALSANSAIINVPVYFLLQMLFSIMGMMVLAISFLKMPIQCNIETNVEQNKLYWPLFSIVLAIILIFRLTIWSQFNTFWGVFMAVMGSACYAWLFVSIVLKNYLQKNIQL